MKKQPLNTSYKFHTIIALVISVWLVSFLVLIAPFDASDLDFTSRLKILPIYGVLSFITYLLMTIMQNAFYRRYQKWPIALEGLFLLTFNGFLMFFCYAYYKTDIVNGPNRFQSFALEIYHPICIILLPIIIVLRWFLNKKGFNRSHYNIVLKGANKLDVLQIPYDDLVCISSADNYIEVHYLSGNTLDKKLLRNTLKNIQDDIPELIKVHRSHLINPQYFKAWNGTNSIVLTKMEIPVSKNYRAALLDFM